ncbi:MAG: hypothetical protein ABJL99_12240 [Aliishimia sp.]
MTERFEKLHKVPAQPAARLLAVANAKLKTKLKAPANASVDVVLKELEAVGGHVDMLRLLSAALPSRESVWWACLAARDVLEDGDSNTCLKAAEAWVFDPTTENRQRIQAALDAADPGDKTVLSATAALYAPGNLGDSDDMKDTPAPIGVVANCAFGMNLKSLKVDKDPIARMDLLIDRAVDIARGGNGKIAPAAAPTSNEDVKEEAS